MPFFTESLLVAQKLGLGEEKRRDFSHRRKQAVLDFRLAQHRLFRPVWSKPAKNLGQTPQRSVSLMM